MVFYRKVSSFTIKGNEKLHFLKFFFGTFSKRLCGPPPPPPPSRNVTKLFILDFNCQPLGRVPICFMSVGPYGPGGVLLHLEGRGGLQGEF